MSENFTTEDLLAELRVHFNPARQPGDIDAYQLMEDNGCGYSTAMDRMNKIAEFEEWQLLTVQDPDRTKPIRVLRKVG